LIDPEPAILPEVAPMRLAPVHYGSLPRSLTVEDHIEFTPLDKTQTIRQERIAYIVYSLGRHKTFCPDFHPLWQFG